MPPPAQRVAIVNGAARGIGAAVAEHLAAVGHAVGVLDLARNRAGFVGQVLYVAGGPVA